MPPEGVRGRKDQMSWGLPPRADSRGRKRFPDYRLRGRPGHVPRRTTQEALASTRRGRDARFVRPRHPVGPDGPGSRARRPFEQTRAVGQTLGATHEAGLPGWVRRGRVRGRFISREQGTREGPDRTDLTRETSSGRGIIYATTTLYRWGRAIQRRPRRPGPNPPGLLPRLTLQLRTRTSRRTEAGFLAFCSGGSFRKQYIRGSRIDAQVRGQ